MPRTRRQLALLLTLAPALGACGEDALSVLQGSLQVTIINPQEAAAHAFVAILADDALSQANEAIDLPETIILLEAVPVGTWDVTVRTLGLDGTTLRSVTVDNVVIANDQVTEIVIDLGEELVVELPCDPTSDEVWPLCTTCTDDGELVTAAEDERCGVVDCSGFETWELSGDNSATGESTCTNVQTGEVLGSLCDDRGACLEASAETCPVVGTITFDAGICERLDGCAEGAPTREFYAAGTVCGTDLECDGAGHCLPVQVAPEVGCADGEREGFLALATYPTIAGCSGAWSVGGVTRSDLAPTCARGGGDDSSLPDGGGCSAVDLCASGWHVCLGKDEVASEAGSCADAVPPGTPDKGLLFAVAQNSTLNSVCDDTTGANDVFGCGNLGIELTADKNCAPLDRALASTQPNSCGFNEAEPSLGPWVCEGGAGSDLEEGALVKKDGCPGTSCEYSGQPVGSSDKGGVLCCRD